MLFAGAVHPHGSIVRPIIIHTVCICQFIPPHFSPNLHPMGCFPPPAGGGGAALGGGRRRAGRGRGGRVPPGRENGRRPFRRPRRRAGAPHPPQTFPPQTPPNRQKHPAGTAPPGDAFAVFGYLTRTSSYLRVPTPIFSACSRQVRQSVSGELLVKWSWWSQKSSAAMLSASWLSGSGC